MKPKHLYFFICRVITFSLYAIACTSPPTPLDPLPMQDETCTLPSCRYLVKDLPLAHGASSMRVSIQMHPELHDEVTNWGDCLERVIQCFERTPRESASGCFQPSEQNKICDARCLDEAQARLREGMSAKDALTKTFLEEGASCRPKSK